MLNNGVKQTPNIKNEKDVLQNAIENIEKCFIIFQIQKTVVIENSNKMNKKYNKLKMFSHLDFHVPFLFLN